MNTEGGPALPGGPFTLTIAVVSPDDQALSSVRITQALTPTLALADLEVVGGSKSCVALPCELGEISAGATALITATYEIAESLRPGSLITHTTILTATGLGATRTATGEATVQHHTVRLPLLQQPRPDPYAQWRHLAAPAPGRSVNYLYIAGGMVCAGPVGEEALPAPMLAATDGGLFQLQPAAAQGELPTWQLRTSADIEASHIVAGPDALFASVFNRGEVLRSDDGGATWHEEPLPGNQGTYWLAVSGTRVLAAGKNGLFIREGGLWVAEPRLTGAIFSVAAADTHVYAVQIGDDKDTLWRSTAGGAAGTWEPILQPPDPVRLLQVLDARPGSMPELLVGTVGGGVYALGPSGLMPFSQGVNLTAYGIWRDGMNQVYVALREPGGLQRFASDGGDGERLSDQPGGPPSSERLYTVSGRAGSLCDLIGVGSQAGDVWVRRIP